MRIKLFQFTVSITEDTIIYVTAIICLTILTVDILHF